MRDFRRINSHTLWMVAVLSVIAVLFAITRTAAFGSAADAIWPEFSMGDLVVDGNLGLDMTHAQDGYVICCAMAPTPNRLKLQMVYGGSVQLMYDLSNNGAAEIFPLQMGSGDYVFSLFENVDGSKYAAAGQIGFSAGLADENAAFLVPNQYVNYTQDSPSVQKSDELSGGGSQKEIFQAVCDFMTAEFSYDFVRAQSISPGELPEIDSCFEQRSGICQDLAAVMVSMLRVQGIPSKLVIGYADGYYHAWTSSIVDGEEIFFDPTAAINAIQAGSYQVERFY